MIKYYTCPKDNGSKFREARKAIECYSSHYEDLFSTFTLAEIGRQVGGLSRERVRQIANAMDESTRKQDRKDKKARPPRGKAADARRKTLARELKRSKSIKGLAKRLRRID